MYTLKSNQYLPHGFGRPASTYYYFENEKGQTVDIKTLKPYKGKQMDRYAMYSRTSAEAYLEVLNGTVRLTEEQFDQKYNMVKNHFFKNPEDCPFNGSMFETYGQEYDHILSVAGDEQKKRHLWTIVEGDTDNIYYLSGFHYVNRIGYFLTEEPWETCKETIVEIVITMDN